MTFTASDVVLAFLSALHALPARPGVFNPWVDNEPAMFPGAELVAVGQVAKDALMEIGLNLPSVPSCKRGDGRVPAGNCCAPVSTDRLALTDFVLQLATKEAGAENTQSMRRRGKQTRTEAGCGAATPNKRRARGPAVAAPDKGGPTTVRRSRARPASTLLERTTCRICSST